MAVLTTFKIEGDPDELLAQKKEKIDPISMEKAREHGGSAHIVVRAEDGLQVFNIWESLEGSEKMAEEMRPVAQEAGMPRPTGWQQWEILQHETPS